MSRVQVMTRANYDREAWLRPFVLVSLQRALDDKRTPDKCWETAKRILDQIKVVVTDAERVAAGNTIRPKMRLEMLRTHKAWTITGNILMEIELLKKAQEDYAAAQRRMYGDSEVSVDEDDDPTDISDFTTCSD